jgi:hypothetical protein
MYKVTLAFLILWPTLAMAQSSIAPEIVIQRIATSGAKSVVDSMYQNGEEWRQVVAGVATGDEAWLNVAVKLRPGTDAGTAEQLILSIGEALGHRPLSVLKITAPVLGIKKICGGPDVDDVRFDSYALSIKEIDTRTKILGSITDLNFVMLRDKCISELNDSKLGIASFYGIAH